MTEEQVKDLLRSNLLTWEGFTKWMIGKGISEDEDGTAYYFREDVHRFLTERPKYAWDNTRASKPIQMKPQEQARKDMKHSSLKALCTIQIIGTIILAMILMIAPERMPCDVIRLSGFVILLTGLLCTYYYLLVTKWTSKTQ